MSNDPVLMAYAVRRGRAGRVCYQRIGRAYPHEAGEGLTVMLDALPLRARHIILLELNENDDCRLIAEAKRLVRKSKGAH